MTSPTTPEMISWNWGTIPSRNGAGGDIYVVLLLLRPWLIQYRWTIERQIDGVGHGLGAIDQMVGKTVHIDDLIAAFEGVTQVIDGEIVGIRADGTSHMRLEVVDNAHLVVQRPDHNVFALCSSLFGPPEDVS